MNPNVSHKRTSCVLGQSGAKKKNVQPTPTTTHNLAIRVNRAPPINRKGKWINRDLEEAMDVLERGITTLRKASRHWNISICSLLDHLNGRTRNQYIKFGGVLTYEEDVAIVTWILAMQEVGLYINLQQLKLKWKF